MKTAALSLVHRVRAPRTAPAQGARPPLLLLLHGVGSHEDDLFALAPALDPRFLTVSVRAPLPHPPGFGWYPVEFTPDGIRADETLAPAGRDRIVRFLDEALEAYGADRDRAYLLGFSQGAAMALFVALTFPERVAGAVLMSGRLIPAALAERASDAALAGLPLLAVHGVYDPILPIGQGRALCDQVGALPVALTYAEYPMAHEVRPDSLARVAAWLSGALDAPGRAQ